MGTVKKVLFGWKYYLQDGPPCKRRSTLYWVCWCKGTTAYREVMQDDPKDSTCPFCNKELKIVSTK